MIRPEQEGSGGVQPAPQPQNGSAAQDFWAYVQDERRRYPRLWRVRIRVHARAFRLAFPEYTLNDVWKLGDNILRDVVSAIHANEGPAPDLEGEANDRFKLQMPVFPTENQAADFKGTWRGWLTIGRPELVY